MSPETIGLIGIAGLLILIFSGMPVGFCMIVAGFIGYIAIGGFDSAFYQLGSIPFYQIANINLTMLPLFMLMAMLASEARISTDLYNTAHKWVGQFRGGLAMSTILAGASFGAIATSGFAGSIALGKVAYPEMERYGYDPSLASGCIAVGSGIADMIPPSTTLIFYGLLTNQSIGQLFVAGILPGILQATIFITAIYLLCLINPKLGPAGPRTSFKQKVASLKGGGPVIALFILCIGGIYLGIFSPTEAGGIGACGAFVIGISMRRLSRQALFSALLETGRMAAMLGILICGAMIFSTFMAISNLPFALSDFIIGLEMNRYLILGIVLLFYIIAGVFLDIGSVIILTVPILFPLIQGLGFNPIWYGVLMVVMGEMGVITPPFGMLVYALAAVVKIPAGTIFRGVFPFVIIDLVFAAILIAFPQIVLWLPNTMIAR